MVLRCRNEQYIKTGDMKTIRIGNDIHVRWKIMRSGTPEDFEGKDVHVCLTDQYGGKYYPDISLTGDGTIEFTFFGKDQSKTGIYTLTLYENGGKQGMVTVDRTEVFRLVARQNTVVSSGGNGGCGCGGVLDVEAVDIQTDLMVPSLGKGVVRCYNISRDTWGDGLGTDGDTVGVRLSKENAGLEFDEEGRLRCTGGGGGMELITEAELDEILNSNMVTGEQEDIRR